MTSALCIVVVLYRKNVSEIRSWKLFETLVHLGKIELCIVDNTVDCQLSSENEMFCASLGDGVRYFGTGVNYGLSKAYNLAWKNHDNPWYMFADDDTLFSEEYVNNVMDELAQSESIICGVITADGKPFSPIREPRFFSKQIEFITSPGDYRNIYAVNSGLVINRKILELLGGFDERLFLDMVDYDLMDRLIEADLSRVKVLAGSIEQSFSGNTPISLSNYFPRLRMFARDIFTYSKLRGRTALYPFAVIVKRAINVIIGSLMIRMRKDDKTSSD